MPSVPDGDSQSETGAGIRKGVEIEGMDVVGDGEWGTGGQCVGPPLQVSCQAAWGCAGHEQVAAENAQHGLE